MRADGRRAVIFTSNIMILLYLDITGPSFNVEAQVQPAHSSQLYKILETTKKVLTRKPAAERRFGALVVELGLS